MLIRESGRRLTPSADPPFPSVLLNGIQSYGGVPHCVPPSRLQSSGRGFAEPIADNGSEAGRALNRRVEVRALE